MGRVSRADFLETSRLTLAGKSGATPEDTPTIFERLSIDPMTWTILVRDFGRSLNAANDTISKMSCVPVPLRADASSVGHDVQHPT